MAHLYWVDEDIECRGESQEEMAHLYWVDEDVECGGDLKKGN